MNPRILLNLMSYICMALFLGFVIFFWVTFLWPYKPVIWHDNVFPIVTPIVKAGEQVTFTMRFDKTMDIAPKVIWYLVDGTVIKLAQGGITRPTGSNNIQRSLLIPTSIYPGIYHVQLEITYEIYPWRKIYYIQNSEDFKVIK